MYRQVSFQNLNSFFSTNLFAIFTKFMVEITIRSEWTIPDNYGHYFVTKVGRWTHFVMCLSPCLSSNEKSYPSRGDHMNNQYHYHLHDFFMLKKFSIDCFLWCYTLGNVLGYGREQAPTLASTLELVICLDIWFSSSQLGAILHPGGDLTMSGDFVTTKGML